MSREIKFREGTLIYIGTVQQMGGALIWHIYERTA